jgi:hypothetical protein
MLRRTKPDGSACLEQAEVPNDIPTPPLAKAFSLGQLASRAPRRPAAVSASARFLQPAVRTSGPSSMIIKQTARISTGGPSPTILLAGKGIPRTGERLPRAGEGLPPAAAEGAAPSASLGSEDGGSNVPAVGADDDMTDILSETHHVSDALQQSLAASPSRFEPSSSSSGAQDAGEHTVTSPGNGSNPGSGAGNPLSNPGSAAGNPRTNPRSSAANPCPNPGSSAANPSGDVPHEGPDAALPARGRARQGKRGARAASGSAGLAMVTRDFAVMEGDKGVIVRAAEYSGEVVAFSGGRVYPKECATPWPLPLGLTAYLPAVALCRCNWRVFVLAPCPVSDGGCEDTGGHMQERRLWWLPERSIHVVVDIHARRILARV